MDTLTGQCISGYLRQRGRCVSALSPDGNLVAFGNLNPDPWKGEQTIQVWDVHLGQQVAQFPDPSLGIVSVAFAPDGRSLATGLPDGRTLIWDLSALDRSGPTPWGPLNREQFDDLWDSLIGSADTAVAYRAVRDLAAAADLAIPHLRARFQAGAAPDPKRVRQLVAELDSANFDTRESASKELERLGAVADFALSEALAGRPSAEARKRMLALLEKPWYERSPELLARVRAVQVLERIRSPKARQLLRELAEGGATARETRAAQAALYRLDNFRPVR